MDWRTVYNATKAMIDDKQARVDYLQSHPILASFTLIEQGKLIMQQVPLIKKMQIAIKEMEKE